MSTPSRIIIKVRKEDIGRKIKFDPNKLPLPLGDWKFRYEDGEVWRDESGKETSRGLILKGEYIGIYCHYNGFPDSVGAILKESFNDYETALNLLAGGWCGSIDSEGVNHYANRKDYKWSNIKPLQGSLEYLRKHICGQYEYIFDNEWEHKKC